MSVLWFLDHVWPRIQLECPASRFVVAGAQPPPELRDRAGTAVVVTGWVDDLGSLYAEADVFVAPLILGAGLKFKVPQAMVYGLPVVATPIAAEGIVEHSGASRFAS